jgi:hypothetical protein
MAEPDGLKLLVKQLGELAEYASYYVTAKTDSVKLSLRNVVLGVWFAAVAFVIVAGLIITATWFLLDGIAEGVSGLFGGRLWVGNIVAGFLLLIAMGLVIHRAVAQHRTTSRERVVRKYEQRQSRQQAQYGHHVHTPRATTGSHEERARVSGRSSSGCQDCDGSHVAGPERNPDASG